MHLTTPQTTEEIIANTLDDLETQCTEDDFKFIKRLKNKPKEDRIMCKIDKDKDFFAKLSCLFTRISVKSGVKGEVDQINGRDIIDMILTEYKHLSLLEISKAFQLNRHGVYDERVGHFGLFNSEYVSDVLKKYEAWKDKAINNSKKLLKKIDIKATISDEEKEKRLLNYEKILFNEFKQSGKISGVNDFLYDFLKKKGLLNQDEAYKKVVYKRAIKSAKSEGIEQKNAFNSRFTTVRKDSNKLDVNQRAISIAKEMVLIDYFKTKNIVSNK